MELVEYIIKGILNIYENDVPNWTTLVVEILITILIFVIGWVSTKNHQQTLEQQFKADQKMNNRFEKQIEYTKKLVESIKSTLDEDGATVFKESMNSFVFKKIHEYLSKFINLWGRYKDDEMIRMGHRIEDEIDIIAQNMQDLIAKSELEIPSEKLEPIKELAIKYDKFAHRMAYIGDYEKFNDTGDEIYQKTLELKEIIANELQKTDSPHIKD